MTLTLADKHYWRPIPQVVDFIASTIPLGAKVLEIGPGKTPFPRATAAVDFNPEKEGTIRCNVVEDGLPFSDQSFDFIYARHVLEDSHDPFAIIREMERVGKAGYIETPSPIAELCRGTDGAAPPWRGYHHHRFIIWSTGKELRLVSKYPIVEYLQFDEHWLEARMRDGPKYWNTYHGWVGSVNARHRQTPLDYDIPRDYRPMLEDATRQAKANADEFWRNVPDNVATIAAPMRRYGVG